MSVLPHSGCLAIMAYSVISFFCAGGVREFGTVRPLIVPSGVLSRDLAVGYWLAWRVLDRVSIGIVWVRMGEMENSVKITKEVK